MNILIRNVIIEDLPAVAGVEGECFPEAEAASKSTFKQRILTFPESFFVAEKDGLIIGFVNGCATNKKVIFDELYQDTSLHDPKGDYQTVFGLDVIKVYRNQGVAAKLMQHMIKTSKEAGRKGIALTCKEHLIHYYEKFGYVNNGVSESVHGGAVWYDMLLEF